ncbi:SIMPL domain-containing protein [Qipengyuania sp. ASV99]|uniref:SIMPL domain-containing protein n=1 Tax=Qipengyuania sp. ASV99 TaxID=3399681 RepID=UPI003A4C5EE2
MIRYPLSLLVSGALLLPVFALSTTAAAAEIEIKAQGPVIELSIYESVTAAPDIVTIGAGVSTEAPSAVEAMQQNAAAMQRVIARIRALGVADQDIQTTGINLNAQYDYDRDNQRQVFRGYQVSNRVSVKLRDIEGTGAALDALVAAGATDLSGPSFSIEDDESAKDLARSRAVERAQQRAQAYAALLGYDGVRVLAVSEVIEGRSQMPQMEMRMMASDGAAATPVQPGQVSTGVNITIKYEMVSESAQ